MNELIFSAILFFIGIITSFINAMAGGGSVLTLGVMMLMGIDGAVANGTNRIGILLGAISGVLAYRTEKYSNIKLSLIFGLWAIPGAIIGSLTAVNVSNALFQKILAVVMIFVLATLFIPKRMTDGVNKKQLRFLVYPALFLIGLYAGFIQAGVGFLLMAALRHFLGMNLVRVNMHKLFITMVFSVPAIIVFSLNGKIIWFYAVSLAAGNLIGSWVSVKFSIKKGEKAIKIVLAVAMALMAAKFLF
ncbi:sulfite exporter TauE/SafE family protein [Candidatus Margulisiibacteriota bacterium]